jgi:hypothetical protein
MGVTMEESFEEFSNHAVEKFGDKIVIKTLNISNEEIEKINLQLKESGTDYDQELTIKDFEDYGSQVWLIGTKCPECDSELLGLFGSFEWGIQHGIGHCGNCDEVTFRYYHYIGNCKRPFRIFSIVGF